MTLFELVNDVTIQGDVRISTWKGDEEKILLEIDSTDDLTTAELDEAWEDAEVTYLFSPGDGYLHIEVSGVDEKALDNSVRPN